VSYVAGIDGGQTSTVAAIADESGRVLGHGRAGAADEIGHGENSTRLRDALRDALNEARTNARLPADTRFAAIVAGISGYEGRVYGKEPQLPAKKLLLVHDAVVAHAGALRGNPGIVVIAGTGSALYWSDAKHQRTAGGWGYLFGDEGSAFWLVRESLALMMRAQDDRSTDVSRETRMACEYFGKASLREIARAFYAGEISRHRLASFATEAAHLAAFREIAGRGADRLATLVRSAIAAGAPPVVACTGGMFDDKWFAERFASGIRTAGVHLVEPAHPPEAGALLLAYREAGMPVPELHS
jgi:N-acetylglucosamine kinase-like BadF-type ATPase